jgi:hypothetical protein
VTLAVLMRSPSGLPTTLDRQAAELCEKNKLALVFWLEVFADLNELAVKRLNLLAAWRNVVVAFRTRPPACEYSRALRTSNVLGLAGFVWTAGCGFGVCAFALKRPSAWLVSKSEAMYNAGVVEHQAIGLAVGDSQATTEHLQVQHQ